MVTVTNYAVRKTKDDKRFITLELSGKVELVQSQETGKFYATRRRCSIPSTFDEHVAKSIIGTEIEGEIVRVQSDPYEFTNPQTGEVMSLAYSWAYQPVGETETIGETRVTIMDEA
ncbi:MAG TPA: hypothetical protein VJA82_02125 [Sediminibacterium sp.]|uniref:hypothetical protein n=1 Tax=Sediminibacterium sp. TaxID=1917865 RepID=UPI0008D2C241|nr:hypothetical protein [Sediminibacterium sp.]OHC84131.1 MAG: hypothetical protein A2472_13645 [Sphingobacteriia bacterium RIFOXYC2_FULL_35_18]OHC87822.1 MAG: hypothetical protein A2546_05525 [Sphingobacteriia bacterium RIFOXYD2_FULL_35_12]HLD52077.1 hypothetical protein [Sediminibacterium sp.]